MLILISPAKTLNFDNPAQTVKKTNPVFRNKANQLAEELKKYSQDDLQKLMNISSKLAELNETRFKLWQNDPSSKETKQSLLAFTGEVFRGINAKEFNTKDLDFAQEHLRILSGLYGILQPLDQIQPYRLEMGTKFNYGSHKDLYGFWGNKITEQINNENTKNTPVINLASNEYFKSVNKNNLNSRVITPVFKDLRNGEIKVITVYAKNARGQMVRYIIKNRISEPEEIKHFDINGYQYDDNTSDEDNWVFIR